mgnify:CR=1 FL=1
MLFINAIQNQVGGTTGGRRRVAIRKKRSEGGMAIPRRAPYQANDLPMGAAAFPTQAFYRISEGKARFSKGAKARNVISQLIYRPSAPASRRSGGGSVKQAAGLSATGQRGWNGQPEGGSNGEGSSPVRMMRSRLAPGSATGVADCSARV